MGIFDYLQTYGLSILVIAICVIAFIGLLKFFKVFSKIESKDVKKCIYYALDVALAFGGAAIYFVIFHIDFSEYVGYSFAQLGITTTLYSFYEHFGIRKLFHVIGAFLCEHIKRNPESAFAKTAKKYGLDKALENIQAQIAERDAKVAEEAKKVVEATEQPAAPIQ